MSPSASSTQPRARWRLLLTLAGVLSVMLGWVLWRIFTCSPGYLNRQAVARSNVAQTFVRSFPESRQNIAYGTGIFGQPTWQGRALVAGRYILTIAIPLHANRVSGRIYAVGTPIVTLHEVVGISRLGDGRLVFTYGGTWYIRQEEW